MLNPEFNKYKGLKVIVGYPQPPEEQQPPPLPVPLGPFVLCLVERFHQHSTITIYIIIEPVAQIENSMLMPLHISSKLQLNTSYCGDNPLFDIRATASILYNIINYLCSGIFKIKKTLKDYLGNRIS